jgi:hypothetical protein
MTETWYVLYGGTSVDGMGPGIYVGRTTDEKVALEHYHKCRKDPLALDMCWFIWTTKHTECNFRMI